jgi:hypothetical protein
VIPVSTVSKPLWQQVSALVSLTAGGTITGLSFVPHASADLASPNSLPLRLAALERLAQPGQAPQPPAAASDASLRSAVVNIAKYYLQLAQDRTPAEMEALIWQFDSVDGADHGGTCAVAALQMGRRPRRSQPRLTGDHLDPAGRAGAPALASAG